MAGEMERLRRVAMHVDCRSAAPLPASAAIAPSEKDNVLDGASVSVDADAYLANRLTPLEREQFARDGYFVVENAIPESHSAQMREILSQIRQEKVDAGTLGADEQAKQGAFSQANTLQTQEPVLALLTNERVFSKIVDILGVNIFCYVSHLSHSATGASGRTQFSSRHASCNLQSLTCVGTNESGIATRSTTTRTCIRQARARVRMFPNQLRPTRNFTKMCTAASAFTKTQVGIWLPVVVFHLLCLAVPLSVCARARLRVPSPSLTSATPTQAWVQTVKHQYSHASLSRLDTISAMCRMHRLRPHGLSQVPITARDRNSYSGQNLDSLVCTLSFCPSSRTCCPYRCSAATDGAIPILCKANSAIIFDRRLWHSATPNYSTQTRHATFVGYG